MQPFNTFNIYGINDTTVLFLISNSIRDRVCVCVCACVRVCFSLQIAKRHNSILLNWVKLYIYALPKKIFEQF